MKKAIAALLVGLILGSTGTAVAAESIYWARGGNDYRCEGIAEGVVCKSGGYDIGTTKTYVYVRKSGNVNTQPVFYCKKWYSWSRCSDG